MIATVLSFVYISFLCWCYGDILLRLIERPGSSKKFPVQGFCITCFCGLAAIGVEFTFVSLFLPLGTIISQLLVLVPALGWALLKRSRLSESVNNIKNKFLAWPLIFKIAFAFFFLLILVMHSWTVNHPDTLNYHAQSIQWIEEYPAVPGLANLLSVYGFQSSWFILSALFSFQFTGTTALTFVNAVILIWFIAFVLQKIVLAYASGNKKNSINGFFWMGLLVISFWSYTQIRLTATSGSSDFTTTIYIWLIVYLFFQYRDTINVSHGLVMVFLGFFAVTMKLQSLPIILLPLFYYYRFGSVKLSFKLWTTLLTGILVIGPYVIRNVISSGYLLYPSAFPDVLTVDWKVEKEIVVITRNYITAYARTQTQFSQSPDSNTMKMSEWLPTWWSLKSMADKTILAGIPLLFALSLLLVKKIISPKNKTLLIVLLFLLPGLVFWFVNAPDPRFGYGFLVPVAGILACLIISVYRERILIAKKWLSAGLLLFSVVIVSYTGYRFSGFFEPSGIFQPSGIQAVPYMTVDCNGIKMNTPFDHELCAGTPLPCTRINCSNILPRGKSIRDGFKIKKEQ